MIDIRLHNTTQLAAFAKRDDLAYLLRTGFGIEYEHRTEFAPTDELLAVHKRVENWPIYVEGFERLIEERGWLEALREAAGRFRRPCLLCAEDDPDHCHRRLLAERLQGVIPGLEVVHLR